MRERKVRQPLIAVLRSPLNSLNITFGDLSPQKSLKLTGHRISWETMQTPDLGSPLGKLDMLETCKNLKILSESGKTNSLALVKMNGDCVEISYETGPGQFVPSPFKVPRFIPLNKRTFQTFGLIQAECTKKLTYASFDFSNTDADVIRFVVEYFESIWAIPRKSWKVYVEYWGGKIGGMEEGIKEYWAHNLSISSQKIWVRVGTEKRWSKRAAQFGTAAIRLNNKIAQAVLMRVLERVKNIAESDPMAAGWYLCGLFAGDGVILKDGKRKTPTAVGLSFNPKSAEIDHYTKVFAQIGLHVHKDELCQKKKKVILFSHWRNHYTLLKASDGELFLPRRKNALRFYDGFLTNQYVVPLLRLKLFRGCSVTSKEFARMADIVKRTAQGSLNHYAKLGFLLKSGERRGSKPFMFSLTKEGETFLAIVDKIENYTGGKWYGTLAVPNSFGARARRPRKNDVA